MEGLLVKASNKNIDWVTTLLVWFEIFCVIFVVVFATRKLSEIAMEHARPKAPDCVKDTKQTNPKPKDNEHSE